MIAERTGYIIWFNDWKAARALDKYGTLHYMSRKMNYAVLYVNAEAAEDTVRNVQRLPYVRKIERSYRGEIKTEYERNVPDKTRFYGL
ncbi:YlbG family protein [Cohnella nanjingensis]|uniref:YlbG family protein n=1 Tax=Cohnella nanjingensis TaxID=1387779 RepID=A0A7X0RRF5_9BACL|nr:YlbG family protein [Cohnella nanjingensis]MBB6671146.1 YlbG family protein [Cohnella nanjingensis]